LHAEVRKYFFFSVQVFLKRMDFGNALLSLGIPGHGDREFRAIMIAIPG
jgi:hypothetical protein